MSVDLPAPVLAADDLRVDVDGAAACDGLTFATTGTRILILGAPRALFEATAGQRPILRGSLAVRGREAGEAASTTLVAAAAMAPPLPPRWSVREYVEWSARLSGVPAGDARALSASAIDRLSLGAMAKTELARLVPHAARATVTAAALATSAEVIALEDPLGGLPDEVVDTYAKILVSALEDRAWVVFAPRVPLTSPLAVSADEAIVASATRALAQGHPARLASHDRRFVARIHGPVASIAPEVSARGGRIEEHGSHLLVDLGEELSTSELCAICTRAEVVLIELLPVMRALA